MTHMTEHQQFTVESIDALLTNAQLPTYSELRRLLDESERSLAGIARLSWHRYIRLAEKIANAVPNYSAELRHAPIGTATR